MIDCKINRNYIDFMMWRYRLFYNSITNSTDAFHQSDCLLLSDKHVFDIGHRDLIIPMLKNGILFEKNARQTGIIAIMFR